MAGGGQLSGGPGRAGKRGALPTKFLPELGHPGGGTFRGPEKEDSEGHLFEVLDETAGVKLEQVALLGLVCDRTHLAEQPLAVPVLFPLRGGLEARVGQG